MSRQRLRRAVRALVAVAILAGSSVALSAASHAAPGGTAVSRTKTVSRYFVDADGTKHVVDHRNVTFTVDQTTNLRSLQLVHVSWKGARPTAGIVSDENSDLAQNEEYSFAIFECRGTDTKAHPITPNTCWTQYGDERFQYDYNSRWPAWRSDAQATTAQRAAVTGAPKPIPAACKASSTGLLTQRWVPFDGADGTVYPGGYFGCGGLAPEATPANLSSLSLPSNETFGVTGLNGTGSTDFDIFTDEDHSSLGCSQSTACSLVAVPIMGISCDPYGTQLPAGTGPKPGQVADATTNCENEGTFAPGSPLPLQASGNPAVDGTLWWSPSNWANRISIPLHFAASDNVCSLTSGAHSVDIYGSELMTQATTQWAPDFCLDSKLFDLTHVQTPEPQARSLLASNEIEAAFTSNPSDTQYPNPTVSAPTSVSGFGIAFTVDNDDGQPVTTLKLDARLLAKLLTESYPDQLFVQDADKSLSGNPLNITFDPEFQALNPGIPAKIRDQAATLLTVSSDSDLMYALTSYINADPEARAWLNGQPDPWGMKVNPAYKKIKLPVSNWPLLDTFEPTAYYKSDINHCLYLNPVPYLPLVAAPTSRLFTIGQAMQFAIAQSQTTCQTNPIDPNNPTGAKLVANGRQSSGSRFMLGTVDLGDAAREGLPLASLESTSSVDPTTQITDDSGRTFVKPSPASLRAAADLLQPDAKTGTWPVPYPELRQHADAYPGTMVVYTAIPTQGLPAEDAKDLGKFLQFAAGAGQHSGTGQGDLPGGYLPITAGNGLGDLAAYTQCAAGAVAAQKGADPSVTGTCPVTQPPSTSSSSAPPDTSTSPPPVTSTTPRSQPPGQHQSTPPDTSGNQPAPPVSSYPDGTTPVPTSSLPSGSPTLSSDAESTAPSAAPSTSQAAALTPSVGSTVSGLVLPIVLGIALAAGLGITAMRIRPRGRRAR